MLFVAVCAYKNKQLIGVDFCVCVDGNDGLWEI